jgi:hypothetical protein
MRVCEKRLFQSRARQEAVVLLRPDHSLTVAARLARFSYTLYDRVALNVALAGQDVRPGDVATLVDFVAHPAGGPRGCVLEFFHAVGESIRVLTVPENAIEPLRAEEVLSVRPLSMAR